MAIHQDEAFWKGMRVVLGPVNEEHSIGSAHVRKVSERRIGRREHFR
jgi:hypothetical protein